MLNKKIIIYIIVPISIFIYARNIFAQGLDIGGNVSFSYTSSDGTDRAKTLEDAAENFTHIYSYNLNIKNDLTEKGSLRTAVRYSINEAVKSKTEVTDLNFDLSYDIIACSLGLTDDTNSDFTIGVSNTKTNKFSFSINPEVLPRFSFNYSNSIKDSQLTTTSDNTAGVQFSKNFKIQDSNISSAISFNSNSTNSVDSPTVNQTTNNALNLSYSTKLLDNKLSFNSGYRVGNNYDVATSVNSLTESGDASFSFNLLENLNINCDWTKSNSFNSQSGRKDVSNANGFRIAFTPIKNLSFSTSAKTSETQTVDSIDNTNTRDFSVRIPPIFDAVNIGYTYTSSQTKNTITANDSIDLSIAPPGSLNVSDFTASARYGFGKKHSVENNNASEAENFGFNLSGKLIERLDCTYAYVLDKNNSNIPDDNRDDIRNTITLNYSLMLIEDLNSSLGTSYSHTQSNSSTASSDQTTSDYKASLDYKLGVTSVNLTGSLTRTFDETGTHLSQRTDFGPGISTTFQGIPISAKLSVGTDSRDAELISTNNINYSLNASYPIGNIGNSSLTYTVIKQENLTDQSANSVTEDILINVSLSF
ncbi:MAG: hypothetical protein PHX78_10395 [bacterium]|nr:hypothetical protein [bacterium]